MRIALGESVRHGPVSPKDVLNTLLAIEALLVAASTLAAAVGSSVVAAPQPKTFVPHKIARAIAHLMVVAGVGGLAAWIDVYLRDRNGINGGLDVIQALALLAPLLSIPFFGYKAAGWAKPD